MVEVGAILGVVLLAVLLATVILPYFDGRGVGDPRTFAGMSRVTWYFYRLGVKHDDAKRLKAELRVREWQARR